MSHSKQNVLVINSSHFVSGNGNNKFVYKFQPAFQFSSYDKIGVQSLSIFNSFYNISEAQGNNKMTINFPCFNPSGTSTAVVQGSIGNAIQFQGQITNPNNIEINGATISQTSSFTGFIGGAKVAVTGYISGNVLRITTGSPALAIGQFINGSDTRIVSGSNAAGWTLNNTALSPLGSVSSPVNTIFATATGNTLYVTTTPTAALSGTLYVQGNGLTSQTLVNTSLSTLSGATYTLSSSTPIFLSSRSILAGVGTNTFTGFSNGTIYNGMQFFYNSVTYTIQSNSLTGSIYTLTLDKVAGIFVNQTIQNVGIPSNSFSILTVTGDTIGSGIYLSGGNTMYLSGVGIGSNIIIQSQISSEDSLTGVAGVYKITYSPNTGVQTMYANDKVTTNTRLYVTSVSSGIIQTGMQFKINGLTIQITGQVGASTGSVGVYSITTPSGIIPSIYPQQISASASFSNSISLNVTIPDGFYDAQSLNYYLQNTMLANKLYILNSNSLATFFIEVVQNSTYYGLQINLYSLPKQLGSQQTLPSGSTWTLLDDPDITYNPQIILPAGLQTWFGFSQNSVNKYPFSIDSETSNLYIPSSLTALQNLPQSFFINAVQNAPVSCYTFVSDVSPVINTVRSLVMDCNLVNSKYNTDRSNIFYSIPMSSQFGQLITIGPTPPCLCSIYGGFYSEIVLSFYDTLGNPVNIKDSDATITLILSVMDDIPSHQKIMP